MPCAAGRNASKEEPEHTMTTQDQPWLSQYPAGVPASVDTAAFPSLVALMQDSFARHAQRVAFSFMGREMRYATLDAQSRALAAWLQGLGLARGDRVALMLPNLPQYPVAVAAVLRAGLVVVNVNPLYTPRELEHQLQDSGAKAIVIMENFAATLQACLARTQVRHVLLTSAGDALGGLRGALANFMLRRVRQQVPPFQLPHAMRWGKALAQGAGRAFTPVPLGGDDLAVLQYTGGTTGVSKGAMLLHRNLVANTLQAEAWYQPVLRALPAGEQVASVCALPLYHIFAFTAGMMLSLRIGGKAVLIPNPRDLDATLKELARHRVHTFPAVNTLFASLLHHPGFAKVDWSALKIAVGGGMAVQSAVARQWLEKTGCPICEGYGLSETAPVAACNPVTSKAFTGSIGLPLPGTDIRILGDDGQPVPQGQPGEIAIRGPQVMAGYWQRPDETAQAMTADGYFKTGDIGVMDAQGYTRIVDRKKDMILVSGFNVYPNEIEDIVTAMSGVLEAAAIGVPDQHTGEAVKLVIVRRDPALGEAQVRRFCRDKLTGYKRPRIIEFRPSLPKSPVGKVLRRALRDTPAPARPSRPAPTRPTPALPAT